MEELVAQEPDIYERKKCGVIVSQHAEKTKKTIFTLHR